MNIIACRICFAAALLAVALSACSDRKTAPSATQWLPPSGDVMRGNVAAGGIPTSYAAYFDQDHLGRIIETRKPADSSNATGDYVFTEARLIQYKGTALHSDAAIELTFDLHGVLTAATPGIDSQEIAAVRTRAQLLRSLALARHASQTHETH